jgi:rRNA maturation protein Nop10
MLGPRTLQDTRTPIVPSQDVTTTQDPDLLLLDDTCPHCGRSADLGEVFDGHLYRCKQCHRQVYTYLMNASSSNGQDLGVVMLLGDGTTYPATPPPQLEGRAKTRARWRRQGRR